MQCGDEIGLVVAFHEAVFVLGGDEAGQTERLGGPLGFDHAPGAEIRAAEIADFALCHEIGQGAEAFLHRRQRVHPVHLVEIDVIGAQPAQRGLHGAHDVAARSALQCLGGVHGHAELGGQHDGMAHLADHLAHQRLGAAFVAIDVGRVEQGDAGVKRGMDHRSGLLEVKPATEIVAPQPDGRHAQA